MNTLLRGVRRLEARGGKLLDRRTAVGKALAAWRASVIEDLGGAEAVSTTQMALIDIAVRSKLVLDSVDAFLLSGRRLANAKRRTVYPVVMQRAQLADGLARTLGQIGLERKARPLPSLAEYLAQRKAEQGREPAQVEEASEA